MVYFPSSLAELACNMLHIFHTEYQGRRRTAQTKFTICISSVSITYNVQYISKKPLGLLITNFMIQSLHAHYGNSQVQRYNVKSETKKLQTSTWSFWKVMKRKAFRNKRAQQGRDLLHHRSPSQQKCTWRRDGFSFIKFLCFRRVVSYYASLQFCLTAPVPPLCQLWRLAYKRASGGKVASSTTRLELLSVNHPLKKQKRAMVKCQSVIALSP